LPRAKVKLKTTLVLQFGAKRAREARNIANLPGYLDDRLCRLISEIERIDYVRSAIKAVRNAIPDGAIEAEQEKLKYGRQQSLV